MTDKTATEHLEDLLEYHSITEREGTLPPSVAKDYRQKIEQAIEALE